MGGVFAIEGSVRDIICDELGVGVRVSDLQPSDFVCVADASEGREILV